LPAAAAGPAATPIKSHAAARWAAVASDDLLGRSITRVLTSTFCLRPPFRGAPSG
jgi:hypothetical protein